MEAERTSYAHLKQSSQIDLKIIQKTNWKVDLERILPLPTRVKRVIFAPGVLEPVKKEVQSFASKDTARRKKSKTGPVKVCDILTNGVPSDLVNLLTPRKVYHKPPSRKSPALDNSSDSVAPASTKRVTVRVVSQEIIPSGDPAQTAIPAKAESEQETTPQEMEVNFTPEVSELSPLEMIEAAVPNAAQETEPAPTLTVEAAWKNLGIDEWRASRTHRSLRAG